MPSQHIAESIWAAVQVETVKAVTHTKVALKTTEILNLLIKIGLKNIDCEDYEQFVQNKKQLRSK